MSKIAMLREKVKNGSVIKCDLMVYIYNSYWHWISLSSSVIIFQLKSW